MKRLLLKMKMLLFMPEMRMFWLFLLVLLVVGALNVIFLPRDYLFSVIGAFLLLALMLFIITIRLANTTATTKVERNQIKAIISEMSDGVIAYNDDFSVILFNKAAEEIFGLSSDEVVGEVFSPDRVREDRYRALVQVLFPTLAPSVTHITEPDHFPQESHIVFEDPELEIKVITSKILDKDGKFMGFFKVIHDETRERALLRAKSEFITVAAHQLRTPLAAINWVFQGLVSGSFGNVEDSVKEAVDTGSKAAKKLSKTVDDLLDVSRMEEGKFGYQFEKTNVVELLQKTLEPYMAIAREHNVQIYFDNKIDPNTAEFIMDPTKVSLAVQNLMDNALKYNVENGTVTVGLYNVPDQPYVKISVQDTGIGIPEEERDKLFTKFFRAQNVLKYETEGTGLGLYIVKNIVDRHGGEITAESTQNRGSLFTFTLPTKEELLPKRDKITDIYA